MQKIPPRSRLYNIPPIGTGTAHIESLTSYTSRLVNAHNLNTGVFFTKIIFPYLGKDTFPRDGINPRKSCSLNNYNQSSKELVNALTDLTTNRNLEKHTLLDFSSFLSTYEIRSNKYWCPHCFQELKDKNLPIYEKLLWVFEIVEVCHIHNCELICKCPTCNTNQYHLSRNSIMGHCYKCGSWLGYRESRNNTDILKEHLHWQQYIIENLEALLLLDEIERKKINDIWVNYEENIMECFKKILNNHNITKGNFFKLIKVPDRLYYYWKNGEQRLSLNTLIKLCYVTNNQLSKFLFMQVQANPTLTPLPDFVYNNIRNKNYKKFELEELRNKILSVINDTNQPPISLSQLTKSLGYKKPETLRSKLPYETDIIVKNFNNYINDEKQKRRNEIRKAVENLFKNGIYPSQKKVEEELGIPSYFWKNSNRKILNEVCVEIGIIRKKGPHTKIKIGPRNG
ncbi:TniQ family protein [Bacillus sp. ISL-37]|uniref:TniQ family protein n=1 Tax=Bacillus sp. ISL-37 TaxID=2819123 RepID=UPI001BEAAFEE|nr:TniQ family protein [Bacillus sp. ISL-37]MBT2685306.1 TniQ family protein [Bacillus sp. ISL-37]